MLERTTLLLLPWNEGSPPAGKTSQRSDHPRRVIDPENGAEVGTVRWRHPDASFWTRWLKPPLLEVREAVDEPLLCTLRRYWSWGPVWQVREADGHRVAMISRREIRNRADRRLAVFHEFPDRDEWEMQGQDGRPLAVVRRSDEGDVLSFAPLVEGNPFVKMALLGAALTRDVG
jgi:hypothetical protein